MDGAACGRAVFTEGAVARGTGGIGGGDTLEIPVEFMVKKVYHIVEVGKRQPKNSKEFDRFMCKEYDMLYKERPLERCVLTLARDMSFPEILQLICDVLTGDGRRCSFLRLYSRDRVFIGSRNQFYSEVEEFLLHPRVGCRLAKKDPVQRGGFALQSGFLRMSCCLMSSTTCVRLLKHMESNIERAIAENFLKTGAMYNAPPRGAAAPVGPQSANQRRRAKAAPAELNAAALCPAAGRGGRVRGVFRHGRPETTDETSDAVTKLYRRLVNGADSGLDGGWGLDLGGSVLGCDDVVRMAHPDGGVVCLPLAYLMNPRFHIEAQSSVSEHPEQQGQPVQPARTVSKMLEHSTREISVPSTEETTHYNYSDVLDSAEHEINSSCLECNSAVNSKVLLVNKWPKLACGKPQDIDLSENTSQPLDRSTSSTYVTSSTCTCEENNTDNNVLNANPSLVSQDINKSKEDESNAESIIQIPEQFYSQVSRFIKLLENQNAITSSCDHNNVPDGTVCPICERLISLNRN